MALEKARARHLYVNNVVMVIHGDGDSSEHRREITFGKWGSASYLSTSIYLLCTTGMLSSRIDPTETDMETRIDFRHSACRLNTIHIHEST